MTPSFPSEPTLQERILLARKNEEALKAADWSEGGTYRRVKRGWRRCRWCNKSYRQLINSLQLYCRRSCRLAATKARQRRRRWRPCPLCEGKNPILTPGAAKCFECAQKIRAQRLKEAREAKRGLKPATMPDDGESHPEGGNLRGNSSPVVGA